MKIAQIVVRSLMGLMFVFASVTYFLHLMPQPEMTGAMKEFNEGLMASVYLMPTVKTIELICGLALLAGRFIPLVTILLAPILVNIFCVHAFMAPEGLPVAILMGLGNLFLAYCHREAYRPLFKSK